MNPPQSNCKFYVIFITNLLMRLFGGLVFERKCACGLKFFAREADVKRGWAKSCSKSCAARRTNKKTGNYQRFMNRKNSREDGTFDNAHEFSNEEYFSNKD